MSRTAAAAAARPLGGSTLQVSPLALGTMNFGSDWHGVGGVDERTAARLLDAALDAGVTLVDTADVYGLGAAESMLGRLMKGRRSRLMIATKVCGEMRPGDPASGGLSRRHVLKAVDESLRRLRTDHVDLYMAHAPDPRAPVEETFEAFRRIVRQGKARVIGVSNFTAAEWSRAIAAADEAAKPRFNQLQFSLASPGPAADFPALCGRERASLLAWSPLGGGLLTGKYRGGARPPGRRRDPATAFPPLAEGRLEGLFPVLERVALLEGLTLTQAALGWVLSKGFVASAVVGARTLDQLRESLGARPLAPASVSFLDRAAALVR